MRKSESILSPRERQSGKGKLLYLTALAGGGMSLLSWQMWNGNYPAWPGSLGNSCTVISVSKPTTGSSGGYLDANCPTEYGPRIVRERVPSDVVGTLKVNQPVDVTGVADPSDLAFNSFFSDSSASDESPPIRRSTTDMTIRTIIPGRLFWTSRMRNIP